MLRLLASWVRGCSKGRAPPPRDEPPGDASEIEEWDEGGKRLVLHLKAERHCGFARAKGANFVEKSGGKLSCERCMKNPVDEYSHRAP